MRQDLKALFLTYFFITGVVLVTFTLLALLAASILGWIK